MPAVSQVEVQSVGTPRYRCRRCLVERIGRPTFSLTAGKLLVLLFRAERIARSVTPSAMRQTFHQICAAIPLLVLRGVRSIWGRSQEQQLPAGKQQSHIERKSQLIGRDIA